jgi:hypothetical protein
MILQNRCLTIREIAKDVGISYGSCQAILTDKFNMHRVAAKFMPRVLTEDQKANRVNISQELLDRISVDENFLKTIVTGDETWIYGYDIKNKYSVVTMGGARIAPTEESSNESIERDGDVGVL